MITYNVNQNQLDPPPTHSDRIFSNPSSSFPLRLRFQPSAYELQIICWTVIDFIMSSDIGKTKQDYDAVAPESARSEAELAGHQAKVTKPSSSKFIWIGIALGVVVGLIVLGVVLLGSSGPNGQVEVAASSVEQSASEQYRFQVYCPVNQVSKDSLIYSEGDSYFNSVLGQARLLQEEDEADGIDKYIIYVQKRNSSSDSQSNLFFYCSMVTDWISRNCSQAKAMCTAPGPLFYVEKSKPIEVAWVYDIKDNGYDFVPSPIGPCYSPGQGNGNPGKNGKCVSMRRLEGKSCTYQSPTDMNPTGTYAKDFYISPSNVPQVVHIHGLEVRSSFDGSPLAWMGKGGAVGPAFQSLEKDKYYSFFSTKLTTSLKTDPNVNHIYVKVNRYENFQTPGNLWYHDHAMHVTKANVVLGMAGEYIIHQPQTDLALPQKQYDIMMVAGQNFNDFSSTATLQPVAPSAQQPKGKGRNRALVDSPLAVLNTVAPVPAAEDNATMSEHVIRFDPPEVPFAAQEGLIFQRNQTYRLRILNAQFDSVFTDFTFRTECNEETHDPASCKKILKFSVMGTDSSLFDAPVHNIDKLTISSGERFEVLILFDGDDGKRTFNPISSDAHYVYLFSGNGVIKNTIPLASKSVATPNNLRKFPSDVSKIEGVEFYDLSTINQLCDKSSLPSDPTMCINAVRMRPILRDASNSFFFNGHLSFTGSGRTDNPKIGTTEDWIFINTMVEVNLYHPIHFHLVNFQIIASTKLKKFTNSFMPVPDTLKLPGENGFQASGINALKVPTATQLASNLGFQCSYYAMDFYLQAGVLQPSDNLTKLCADTLAINLMDPHTEQLLKDKFPEDEKDPVTLVSGFDVFAKIDLSSQSQIRKYYDPDCPNSEYKYVCGPLSRQTVPPEYKKWKQIALLQPEMVMQLRVRWASTEYKTSLMPDPYPYFRTPEDELIEFPGYVYHCHFLNHEDNELMRSFMMEPSDRFVEKFGVQGTELGDCMSRKGLSNKDGWKARYQCINDLIGCTPA